MKRLFRVTQGATDPTLTEFRCDIEIKVLSHPISAAVDTDPNKANGQHVAMRFKIYNAWVTSVAYSDLNAGDNALFVEQMSVVHEGFDVHFADNYNVSATNF
jgi:phage tail-like protein